MTIDPAFAALAAAIRSNCLLSDARYAQEQPLCNYLLAMREYYRWERLLPLDAEPVRAEVLAWIADREAQWEALEAATRWEPVPLGEARIDPFDVARANAELVPAGLVYGAGIGRFGKPHFFLGRLAHRHVRDGVEILESDREYVRDIDAAPATLQGDTIFLRREAFERWLWLRAEVWESREGSASMRSALSLYGYDGDRRAALARMAEAERETLILHELGEHAAGRRLGPEWEDLMEGLADRRAEMAARAVRDLLADCLVTLPVLVQRNAVASLHFWFANFTGMRRMLFPLLAQAREAWCAGSDDALAQAIGAGAPHWERVARDLAALGAGVARRVAEGEAGFIL